MISLKAPNGSYTYQWFDPIIGEYSEEYEFTATRFGTYYIGDRPQATDMVLRISATDKQVISPYRHMVYF